MMTFESGSVKVRCVRCEGSFLSSGFRLREVSPGSEVVGKYGENELKTFKTNFQLMKMPMQEITTPSFVMSKSWTVEQLKGYLFTWSATQTAIRKTGKNPVEQFSSRIDAAWGGPRQTHEVSWPVLLRVGRLF